MKANKCNTKAFSVLELLMVMIIITIVAAIIIPTYTIVHQKAIERKMIIALATFRAGMTGSAARRDGDRAPSLARRVRY